MRSKTGVGMLGVRKGRERKRESVRPGCLAWLRTTFAVSECTLQALSAKHYIW
jgi:hypothetical protein